MNHRAVVAVGLVVLAGVVSVAAVGGVAGAEHCSFPVSMEDTTGTEVTVEEAPERVVTLAPSAAQTMWEIGAKEKVVGVSKYAGYLEGASEKRNVSGGERIVVAEKVVAADPDLVIAPNVIQNDTIEQLRSAGITVYRFEEARSIEGVYEKVELIGRLTGACDGAEERVEEMKDRIATVERAVEGQERPDVLYSFFGFTAGSETFIHEIIETAGGNNIAADANISSYREISEEIVVDRNPDWIVLNSDDPAVPGGAAYENTTAVRENQTVVVQIEHINQPAPRIVLAITKLAKAFHPEAYAAAKATATPTATATATATATVAATPSETAMGDEATVDESMETTGSTETPGSSGFGVLTAVVAVVAAVVAVRRRS
ncbi:MAG: PGF-CTERM-anchored ABC transporter substrate-binding protein [Halobacteriales archaeon]